jgi:hypothetical protein
MLYIFLAILIVTSVSAWILNMRMRRRIKNALGGDSSKANLTSLNTWMTVDEAEKRKSESGPLNPK